MATQFFIWSHRNHGNHRKCLWHGLRIEERSDHFCDFLYFCGTVKLRATFATQRISVISVISV